jgi:hypothetical protein
MLQETKHCKTVIKQVNLLCFATSELENVQRSVQTKFTRFNNAY